MKVSRRIYNLVFVFIFVIITGCANVMQTVVTPEASAPATAVPTATEPARVALWIDPTLPSLLQSAIKRQSGFKLVDSEAAAELKFTLLPGNEQGENVIGQVQWIYALVAPFPTITDELSAQALQQIWSGTLPANAPLQKLLVSAETEAIFDSLWGQASAGTVETVSEDQFASNDFKEPKTWAIVPFDQITPRWKVIQIDGLSPLNKPLDTKTYALKANFVFSSAAGDALAQVQGKSLLSALPATNRDESKMTVLMMTGTTALVRAIAYKMEIKGLDYPIEKIKDWFTNADLIHVSNEVSFNPDCPFPDYNGGLQMCSSPRYLQTLQDLGVNVVELTGNHENDYGSQYLESTIDTYKALGWYTFGGGKTPAEAQAPVKIEVNGNKIAFIGCNPDGPSSDWATDKRAGSAQCDMDYFSQQIKDLKSQGYVVIATFQQAEIYNSYIYGDQLAEVFRTAANSGADIVSGSEAHFAMGFQFIGNNLIHFGLGNFLFDQMFYEDVGDNIRREFIDKHIIYDGKYISTQLYTSWLVDWSQPTPMDAQQRTSFLTDVFNGSIWSEKK